MNKKAKILRKKSYFSSNINEVIKAVLKSFFFFTKTFNTLKTLKTQKALKALKAINGISGKSTKRK